MGSYASSLQSFHEYLCSFSPPTTHLVVRSPTNFSTDRAFSPAFLAASSLLPTSGLAYVRFCPCRVALKRDPSSPWPPAFVRPASPTRVRVNDRRAPALSPGFFSLPPLISPPLTTRRSSTHTSPHPRKRTVYARPPRPLDTPPTP